MIALLEPKKKSILDEPVSASRLGLFHSCRLKFFFRYIAKISKPVSPALFVGSSVHHALQEWSRRRWMGLDPSRDELWESFNRYWGETQLEQQKPLVWSEEEESTHRAKAWALVEHYLENTPIPAGEKPLAVEVSVEADLGKHGLPTLRGIIDLVRPGGVIVDYKTAAATPVEEQVLHRHEGQLTAYGLLYREATGEKESGLELHHLIKTKVPKLVVSRSGPVTEAQQAKLFRSIESFVDGVEREDFVPSPGLQCSSCEYFNECRGAVV